MSPPFPFFTKNATDGQTWTEVFFAQDRAWRIIKSQNVTQALGLGRRIYGETSSLCFSVTHVRRKWGIVRPLAAYLPWILRHCRHRAPARTPRHMKLAGAAMRPWRCCSQHCTPRESQSARSGLKQQTATVTSSLYLAKSVLFNSLKHNGKYTCHLYQHLRTLHLAHRVYLGETCRNRTTWHFFPRRSLITKFFRPSLICNI
jgi:hypothetical protein